jgi:mannan endo-1,4-beta-mannosidase
MNPMDRNLRDLLNAAAGEPPHQVTVEAVRHRARRRWGVQYLGTAAVVAVIAVLIPTGIGAVGHGLGLSAAGKSPGVATYLGVFEPASGKGPPGYGPIEEFAKAAGKKPNLVGYYSGWNVPFPMSFADSMHSHGVIPLVQIDPSIASVAEIADGGYDRYLRQYAYAVRNFGHPVVIGFGHDMNAPWNSWGYRNIAPSTFVAAWRHIVNLFRNQGAQNVTWLWTIQADEPGTGPISSLWPGANYVTWVGIDGFYTKPSDSFIRIFARTISQVRALTGKPILLSETGVPINANQLGNIFNLFNGITQYELLGIIWFDGHQYRIEDSALAERTFQDALSGRS